MKEALLRDIAMYWKKPQIRLKLDGYEQDLFGMFTHIDVQSRHPTRLIFDGWNIEDWTAIQKAPDAFSVPHKNLDRCKAIEVFSTDIRELEIIGFCYQEFPKNWAKMEIKPTNTLIGIIPNFRHVGLKSWNLKAEGVIRSDAVLALL